MKKSNGHSIVIKFISYSIKTIPITRLQWEGIGLPLKKSIALIDCLVVLLEVWLAQISIPFTKQSPDVFYITMLVNCCFCCVNLMQRMQKILILLNWATLKVMFCDTDRFQLKFISLNGPFIHFGSHLKSRGENNRGFWSIRKKYLYKIFVKICESFVQ